MSGYVYEERNRLSCPTGCNPFNGKIPSQSAALEGLMMVYCKPLASLASTPRIIRVGDYVTLSAPVKLAPTPGLWRCCRTTIPIMSEILDNLLSTRNYDRLVGTL